MQLKKSLRGIKISSAQKQAFIATFIIGLIAHAYKFTNTLINHDSLYNIYSANDVLPSGRWFLAVACWPSSRLDLPWMNGLLSLLWIALTAVVVVDFFKIRRSGTAILTGGLLAAFPCVTGTFFYEYTADGYMLAMLLAALSARLNMVGDRKVSHSALAALLICLCCGIYQAYVSFALLLCMCHFMLELFEGQRETGALYRWIGRQFIVYGVGLAAYYAIWKLRMYITATPASNYQDAINLGSLITAVPGSVVRAAKSLMSFLLGWNVFEYGLTFYAFMNMTLIVLLAALVVFAAVKASIQKSRSRLLLLVLSIISLPVFTCVWQFVSPGINYYPLMLQSLCVLYVFALVLAERYGGIRLRSAAALFFAVMVFNFSVMANKAYFEMDRCNRMTERTATEMLARIHQLDDGSVSKIAFVGSTEISLSESKPEEMDGMIVLAHMLHPSLMYNHEHASLYFDRMLESGYTPVSWGMADEIGASGVTDDMPVWPLSGSVRIIGDTAVIKLSG